MIPIYKDNVGLILKKAAGQIRLLEKMLAEDRHCLDIAQQINAAIGLLKQANQAILENHLLTCGAHELQGKNLARKKKFVDELTRVFQVANRK